MRRWTWLVVLAMAVGCGGAPPHVAQSSDETTADVRVVVDTMFSEDHPSSDALVATLDRVTADPNGHLDALDALVAASEPEALGRMQPAVLFEYTYPHAPDRTRASAQHTVDAYRAAEAASADDAVTLRSRREPIELQLQQWSPH